MSKTFSMAGWRMGFAVGNDRIIAALARAKSYLDYGAFTPIQVAATAALNGPEDCIREMRDTYRKRRDVVVESFGRAGGEVPPPSASSFAWAPLPKAFRARSKAKKRGLDLRGIAWAKNALVLAGDPGIDCFVELIGGSGEPALSAIETALKSGKSVVTANKALIAKHGLRLARSAEKHGGALNFEAAVGAAIPVIKTLREGLAGTGVNRVYGILNGTCNYILTRMEQEGLSFAECLKDAQRLGYAEANPSFDVDGHDTAQKLAILASLAFGTKVAQSAVYVEGISSIKPEDLRAAEQLGYRVKLLGVAVRTAKGIEQRVHPTIVPKSSSIAQVMGATKAVTIDGAGIPPITLVDPGAIDGHRIGEGHLLGDRG